MNKHNDKSWSGYLLGYVGDPKSNIYPRSKKMMKQALDGTRNVLRDMRNHGVAVFPGDTRVEKVDPPNSGQMFIDRYNLYNGQIMLAMYGSMVLREGDSSYKASAKPDEFTFRFTKGIRTKIREKITEFLLEHLVPELEEDDIEITFGELRLDETDIIVKAITEFSKLGIFKDSNEKRLAASGIFPFFLKDTLDENDASRLQKEFIELNKPSVAGEGNKASSTNNSSSNGKKVQSK